MVDLQKIPLFPLHTVLFPGMVLPLHIFEDRYKLMIYHCVTENIPFGVVLIREGKEVGGAATVFDVGTTAHITRIDPLDDGRMNIATLGFDRFKIHSISHDAPYLTGLIETFPLEDTKEAAVKAEVEQLAPLLIKYLEMIASVSEVDVKLDQLPRDASTLAFLTAIVLRSPMQDKQTLLSIPSLPALLRQERQILGREAEVLRFMLHHIPNWLHKPLPFSPN
jgi:uncharacterized protein